MERSSDFEPVMALADLARGTMRACTVAGRDVLLCHTRHGLSALMDLCTHADARLSEGTLRGERVICPLHGAAFDVRDGRVLRGPARQALIAHQVRVVDGWIEIAVDLRAPRRELI